HTAAGIVPPFDARKLSSQLMDGVNAFFGGEAGVRSAAAHDQFGFADALARGLQQAARTERRLQNEDRVTAARFGFDELARRFAADFLVRSPHEDDALLGKAMDFMQRAKSKERLDDPGLHVESPGAIGLAARDAEWLVCQGSGRIDRVVMSQHEEGSWGLGILRCAG